MTDKDDKKKPAEKPISLKPLEFEEAVETILEIKKPKGTKRPDKGPSN